MSEDTVTISTEDATTTSSDGFSSGDDGAFNGGRTVRITPRVIVAGFVIAAVFVATVFGLAVSRRDKVDARKAVTTTAATIDGIRISNAEIDAIILSWLKSPDFVKGQQTPIVLNGKPTPGFRADILTSEIQSRLFQREFAARKLKISSAYEATLRTQIGQDPITQQLDPLFITSFLENRARQEALRVALAKAPTVAAIQAAYEQRFRCASGKQVSHILVKTKADADAIAAELNSGGDFATIASAKSIDTASATKGGDLGCLVAGQFVAEFETAALAAIPGTPTSPVKSEFGFHIIKTSAFVAPPIATVQEQIVQALTQQDTSFADFFKKVLSSAKVSINPAFGTWQLGSTGFYSVAPPVAKAIVTTTRP